MAKATPDIRRLNATTDVRPRADTETRQTDILANDSREATKPKRVVGDGTLASVSVQKRTGRRFHVCVTAIRKRLLDEDNQIAKYHIDLLRYSGVLPGDDPATTHIEVRQQKAEPGAREEVRIEVYEV